MHAKVIFTQGRALTNKTAIYDGTTGEVVSTNPDVGFAVVTKEQSQPGLLGSTWVKKIGFVIFDSNRLGPMDSIMLHKTIFSPTSVKPSEGYELLAGKEQPCTKFLEQWRSWVFDRTVQNSARSHIQQGHPKINLPEINLLGSGALDIGVLMEERFEVWLKIADAILPTKASQAVRNKFPSGPHYRPTPLQLESLSIRIAQKIGNWKPPIPRPYYAPAPRLFPLPLKGIDQVNEPLPAFD